MVCVQHWTLRAGWMAALAAGHWGSKTGHVRRVTMHRRVALGSPCRCLDLARVAQAWVGPKDPELGIYMVRLLLAYSVVFRTWLRGLRGEQQVGGARGRLRACMHGCRHA